MIRSRVGRLEPIDCPVCGSSLFEPHAVGESFPPTAGGESFLVVRCGECELLYLNPQPVLDVHDGEAEPPGGRAAGAAAGTAADGPAVRLTADDGQMPDPRFAQQVDGDVLPAGTLEMHPDPVALLERLRSSLGSDGRLTLVLDNADSLLMRVFGHRHASLYGFPRRRQIFGAHSASVLARAAGYSVERWSTRGNPDAWTESLHNFLLDWAAPRSLTRGLEGSWLVRLVFVAVEGLTRRKNRGARLVLRLRPEAHHSGRSRGPKLPPRDRRRSEASALVGSSEPPVAILGAGVAGLTAAQLLRRHGIPATVFEAGREIAGLARGFRSDDGFSHDFGAHFITNRFAAALGLGAQCRTVQRFGEAVRLGGDTFRYPFGLLRAPRFLAAAVGTRLSGGRSVPRSAAELYRTQFGHRLAEEIAIPLLEAWSGVPAEELAPSVSPPQLDRGMLHVVKLKCASRLSGRAVANGFSRAQPENPHVFHVYPEEGIGILTERLAEGLQGMIELEARVEAIHVVDGRVRGVRVAGEDRDAAAVISTAPVHVLPKLVRGSDALQPLERFRYRPFALVNMRFDQRPLLSEVCTWIPERQYTFFRLTEAPLAMPWLAPPGKTIVTADIGCQVGDEIWTMDDEMLGRRCLDEMDELFPGARRTYLGCSVLRTAVAHPVYLREYEEDRLDFARGLPIHGLHSVGRNGEFAHILMEDVFWRTRQRVHSLLAEDGFRYAGPVTGASTAVS